MPSERSGGIRIADGTFFALARFADEAAAKKNSARAEQSGWWADTAKLFDGEPTFRESTDITTLFDGGWQAYGYL